jgi:trans-aconitate methyltransferase
MTPLIAALGRDSAALGVFLAEYAAAVRPHYPPRVTAGGRMVTLFKFKRVFIVATRGDVR